MTVKPVFYLLAGISKDGSDIRYAKALERCSDVVVFTREDLTEMNAYRRRMTLLRLQQCFEDGQNIVCDMVSASSQRRTEVLKIARQYDHQKILVLYSPSHKGKKDSRTRSGDYTIIRK